MSTIILAVLALITFSTSFVYAQSARLRHRLVHLVSNDPSVDIEAHSLAFASFRKEVHFSMVYGAIGIVACIVSFGGCGPVVGAHVKPRSSDGAQPSRY